MFRLPYSRRIMLGLVSVFLGLHASGDEIPRLIKRLNFSTGDSDLMLYSGASSWVPFRVQESEDASRLWRSDGTAAGTRAISDVVPYSQVVALDDRLFFSASTDEAGNELWTSDGTDTGTKLVFDIRPGSGSSRIDEITGAGGKVFFSADDGVHGQELWVSDGTSAGTALVADIDGPQDADPYALADVDGTLFFVAIVPTYGISIWTSDGTPEGTALVRSLNTDSINKPEWLVPFGADAVFLGTDDVAGRGLWRSDGTEAGTALFFPFASSVVVREAVQTSTLLYFYTYENGVGGSIWKSNGTQAGTQRLMTFPSMYLLSDPALTVHDDLLFFVVNTAANGRELWRSDGTVQGTLPLFTVASVSKSTDGISQLTSGSDALYFVSKNAGMRAQLSKTDGTPAGTLAVEYVASPTRLSRLGNEILFAGEDTEHGVELWTSDGTAAGTRMVLDINAELSPSNVKEIEGFGDYVLFSASDGTHGASLWRSDGTELGTTLVKDIVPGPSGASIDDLTAIGGYGFFAAGADDEPWITDGTADGTFKLADIRLDTGDARPRDFVSYEGAVFFAATIDFATWGLFRTAPPFTSVTEIARFDFIWQGPSGPYEQHHAPHLTICNDHLVFAGHDEEHGVELWHSDGTSAGTALLKDTAPGAANGWFLDTASLNGTLYIYSKRRSDFEPDVAELWRTDGTVGGTSLVLDLPDQGIRELEAVGSSLFLILAYPNIDLWITDGTQAGMRVLLNHENSWYDDRPSGLFDSGGTLFFTADDAAHGRELWRSDGTVEGTYMVRDMIPGIGAANPTNLSRWRNRVYLRVKNSAHGIWYSDGTESGTQPVVGTPPEPDFSQSGFEPVEANGILFFSGGGELWGLLPDRNGDGLPDVDTVVIARTLLENFDVLDVNDDGQLSFDESLAGVPELTETLFEELDTNQDDELSPDELIDQIPADCGPVSGCGNRSLYETGQDLCLGIPCPVSPFSQFQWSKDGVPLQDDGDRISGCNGRVLQIQGLIMADSGVYTCVYNTGAKTPELFTVQVTVAESVPTGTTFGLISLSVFLGWTGFFRIRRRKLMA